MKGKKRIYLIIWFLICMVYGFIDSLIVEVPPDVAIPFWLLMLIVLIIIQYIKIPKDNNKNKHKV